MTLRRTIRHWYQRRTRGWDDSDLWSLDQTMAKWILPRLRRFRDAQHGHPGDTTEAEWIASLDDMIAAFEIAASERYWCPSVEQDAIIARGLTTFAKRFRALWT